MSTNKTLPTPDNKPRDLRILLGLPLDAEITPQEVYELKQWQRLECKRIQKQEVSINAVKAANTLKA